VDRQGAAPAERPPGARLERAGDRRMLPAQRAQPRHGRGEPDRGDRQQLRLPLLRLRSDAPLLAGATRAERLPADPGRGPQQRPAAAGPRQRDRARLQSHDPPACQLPGQAHPDRLGAARLRVALLTQERVDLAGGDRRQPGDDPGADRLRRPLRHPLALPGGAGAPHRARRRLDRRPRRPRRSHPALSLLPARQPPAAAGGSGDRRLLL